MIREGHQINQWGSYLSHKAAEKATQATEQAQVAKVIDSRISLTDEENALIPEIRRFATRMGHEMNESAQVVMFIKGMTIDYGDQKLLFRDGRVRLELGDGVKVVSKRL